eukprot:COSAG02_NODE_58022_length_278_cov_2.005587_1_plen_35_part_10
MPGTPQEHTQKTNKKSRGGQGLGATTIVWMVANVE